MQSCFVSNSLLVFVLEWSGGYRWRSPSGGAAVVNTANGRTEIHRWTDPIGVSINDDPRLSCFYPIKVDLATSERDLDCSLYISRRSHWVLSVRFYWWTASQNTDTDRDVWATTHSHTHVPSQNTGFFCRHEELKLTLLLRHETLCREPVVWVLWQARVASWLKGTGVECSVCST